MLFSSGSECEEQIVKYLLEMLTATPSALADVYSGRDFWLSFHYGEGRDSRTT